MSQKNITADSVEERVQSRVLKVSTGGEKDGKDAQGAGGEVSTGNEECKGGVWGVGKIEKGQVGKGADYPIEGTGDN